MPRQPPVRFFALGDKHDAGGVAIEAMQDSRPPVPTGEAPFLAVVDEPVDEGSRPSAARGMHDQVCLFVERQEMIVLVNDVERDGLGDELIDRLGRGDHVDLIAVARVIACLDDSPVDLDEPVREPRGGRHYVGRWHLPDRGDRDRRSDGEQRLRVQ